MLPITILAIISVILILIFFYQESVTTSQMHIALRCEAGNETGRTIYYSSDSTIYDKDADSFNINVKSGSLFKSIHGTANVSAPAKLLLDILPYSELEGEWHAADGVKLRRLKVEK